MDPFEIKQGLAKKGCSIAIIARALDLSNTTVSTTIHRKGQSKRAAIAIAKVLGKPVENVFPDVPAYFKNHEVETQKRENYWRERLSA
jgi:lambda repressor-like predicted transcriptional regulator